MSKLENLTKFVSGIIGKVIYLAGGSLTNGHWDAGGGGIGHQGLLKVTNQGHLKRFIDLTLKFDHVCVLYQSEYGKWVLECQ